MLIEFTKYEGAGNDFIMIPGQPSLNAQQIAKLCHRQFGVGADGLIFVDKKSDSSIEMNYFNSDGSYASFCGNGARCAIQFAYQQGIILANGILLVENIYHSYQVAKDGLVTVQLIEPIDTKLHFKIENIQEIISFTNTGVEHVVIDCSSYSLDNFKEFDIIELGSKIRHHQRFAKGTNVNFYWKDENNFLIRTYERGVEDETLACGTGTAAVAYLDMLSIGDYNDRTIETRSGLLLKVKKKNGSVYLCGPANKIFTGKIDI